LADHQQVPNFRELTARLTAYGLKVFAELGIYGEKVVIDGVGTSLEDFVGKVMAEYATGAIKYHSSRGSLMSLLGTALRNDVLDALDKSSHKLEESRLVTPPKGEDKKRESEKSLDEFPTGGDPFPAALDEEEYRARVRTALVDEPVLRELAELVLDLGVEKPQEMAEFLGIEIQELHNRRRKLRRRLLEHQLVAAKKR
jgi:DNA-directed RNA polymerase specialized sigma24 family protein